MAKANKTAAPAVKAPDIDLAGMCDKAIYGLLAFTIFIIPLFFNIESYDQFELPKLTILRILTSLMLGLWAVKTAAAGKFEYTPTLLDIPLALWSLSNIISTFFSIAPQLSFRGEYENFAGSLTNLNYVVLYFIAAQHLRTRSRIYGVAWAFLCSSLLLTTYSVAQFFGYDFIKWNESSVIKGRYFASMGNPNFLGATLIMMMPVNLAAIIINIRHRFYSFAGILFALFIFSYMALFGTQSRGPFLGFVFFLAAFAVYGVQNALNEIKLALPGPSGENPVLEKYKRWAGVLAAVLVIAVVMSVTIGKNATKRITESIADIPGSLKQSRLHIWIPGIKIVKDYPVFGTGVDTYKTIFPKYEGLDFAQIDGSNVSSRTAHNEPLNIAATQGLFGLGVYLWMLWVYTGMFFASFRKLEPGSMRVLSFSFFAAFIAYFVQNLFSFGVAAINTAFYLFMAMHASLYIETAGTPRKEYALPRFISGDALVKSLIYIIAVAGSMFFAYRAYNMYSADVNYNKGKIIGNVYNRWDKAIEQHILSVKKCPNEVKYHVYLGLAYEQAALRVQDKPTQMALLAKSIEYYKNGIRLNPGNSYYWGNLARVYTMLARIDDPKYIQDAIENYKQAVLRAPVTGLFYNNLLDVYLKAGMLQQALETYDKLEYCDKKLAPNAAFTIGNVFFNERRYDGAEAYYRRAVALDPALDYAWFNLAVTAATLNRGEEAIGILEKLLAEKPDFEKAGDAKKIIADIKRRKGLK